MYDTLSLVSLLKTKKISHQELLAECMKSIGAQNEQLNALVHYDQAAYVAQLQQTDWQNLPFAGLPIPLKILGHAKKGWSASASSILFKDEKASITSHFVHRLETLGFIPFGQTNAPEFGFKNVTDPQLYGVSKNPWHTAYSPGGSSGGAAAAVASGMFSIATASDGGGSIRIPASFSGVIGLKPSRGVMPVGPGDYRSWQGASVSFAMTRSMRDTETLFYLLRDKENQSPYQAPWAEWQHHQAAPHKKRKIGFFIDSPIGNRVSEDAKRVMKRTIDLLVQQGHEVEEVSYPIDGKALMQAYYRMNGADTAAMFESIEQQMGRPLTMKDMELMTWGIYQSGKRMRASQYVASLHVWDQAAVSMEAFFQDYDVLLSPSATTTAPKLATDLQSDAIREQLHAIQTLPFNQTEEVVYNMFEKSLHLTPYTQLANLTGQPAISLPMGVAENGLPLGVQLQSAKGREDLLFQLGYELENEGAFQFLHPTKQLEVTRS